jgi:hypothetical protein
MRGRTTDFNSSNSARNFSAPLTVSGTFPILLILQMIVEVMNEPQQVSVSKSFFLPN